MTAVEAGAPPLARNRDYRLVWVSQAVSETGFAASMIAFPLLALAVTGSPLVSGVVLGTNAMAQLLAGLPAGALVDRWDRKRVMLGCEAAQALVLAVLVAALWWGVAGVVHLVVAAAVLGVCRALFVPAEAAAVARIVPAPQLPTAVAMNSARGALGQLSGTAAGGFLFAVGALVPFLGDAVSRVLSFVALSTVRIPRDAGPAPGPAPARRLGREVAEGLVWVWGQRPVRVTVLCAVSLNFFFSAYYIVIVVLARGRGVPAGEIGVMAAMLGVGGILGSLLAPRLHRRLPPAVSIIGVFWVLTALSPLAVFARGGYLIGALFVAMMLLPPTANTTIATYQLLTTPDRLRGRLGSVMAVVAGVSSATGPVFGGLLAVWLPDDRAVLVCAAGIALVAVAVTASPTLRAFPRAEPAPVPTDRRTGESE